MVADPAGHGYPAPPGGDSKHLPQVHTGQEPGYDGMPVSKRIRISENWSS